jgi:hypothetical protein
MTEQPEYYERAPDGERWPGTLKGLLKAIDDTTIKSLQERGPFTLAAIREGQAEPFRTYQNGTYRTAATETIATSRKQ